MTNPLAPGLIVYRGDPITSIAIGGLMVAAGGFGLRHALKMKVVAGRLEAIALRPISHAPAGPVRVRGRIGSSETILSPFTKTPCCAYIVEVDEVCDSGERTSSWGKFHTEVSKPDFLLQDATGTLSIGTAGLEFDVPWALQHEVFTQPRDPFEQAMVDYVRQNCPDRLNMFIWKAAKAAFLTPELEADPQIQERLRIREERLKPKLQKKTKKHSFRFRETCLLPGQEFEAAGTLVLDDGKRVLTSGGDTALFVLSSRTGEEMDRQQRQRARSFAAWSAAVLIAGLLVLLAVSWPD